MLCAKFGWNWPSGSGEEDFFNFVNIFSLFRNYLPLEKGGALHLNKLESPSPKNDLCQVWLELAQRFLRRNFFKFVNVVSLFRNYLPLENDTAIHLNKLESPTPKDALCQFLLKLAQWFWRRRWKCEKFTTTTLTKMTTTTDKFWSEKLTCGELKKEATFSPDVYIFKSDTRAL